MELQREPVIELEPQTQPKTLKEYATLQKMTENQVWELIEEGELSARFLNESIFVFQEPKIADELPKDADLSSNFLSLSSETSPCEPGISPSQLLNNAESIPSELQDSESIQHFYDSLALTREAHQHALEVYQKLLKSKDEIMTLKDEKIAALEAQIAEGNTIIKQMQRELENYATLLKISKNPDILRTVYSGP